MTTHLNQTTPNATNTTTTTTTANSNHHHHQQQQQQQHNQQQQHHQYYHHHQHVNANSAQILECKSKYDAEFRRFGLNRYAVTRFDDFYAILERLHGLAGIAFNIYYTDKDGELLPINNDNNLARVLQVTVGVLRLIIFRRGECYPDQTGSSHGYVAAPTALGGSTGGSGGGVGNPALNYSSVNSVNSSATPSYRAANIISHIKELSTTLTSSSHHHHQPSPKPFSISYPADFRPVSAIIDVDILPESYRRVRLHKHKSSKPLGFYIRDGRSLRVTPNGVEQVPGIFISRLMPGGLAESTGLLSVNDEVIEVNGIEVSGKTLDQVTDMMVANSSNLIITVKPTNQKYNLNRSGAAAALMSKTTSSSSTSTPMNMSANMGPTTGRSSMRQHHHHHNNNKNVSSGGGVGTGSSSSADVSKLSAKSNDNIAPATTATSGLINTVTSAAAANNSSTTTNTTNNGSSMTSSSSVNSSFSSSNQPVNRHSFKVTNGITTTTTTKAAAPIKPSPAVLSTAVGVVDNDHVKLDVTSLKKSTSQSPEHHPQQQQHNSEDEEEPDTDDDDDDDDDDEEIHDATAAATNQNHHHHHYHHHHHNRSSDDDNSDDKILTL